MQFRFEWKISLLHFPSISVRDSTLNLTSGLEIPALSCSIGSHKIYLWFVLFRILILVFSNSSDDFLSLFRGGHASWPIRSHAMQISSRSSSLLASQQFALQLWLLLAHTSNSRPIPSSESFFTATLLMQDLVSHLLSRRSTAFLLGPWLSPSLHSSKSLLLIFSF